MAKIGLCSVTFRDKTVAEIIKLANQANLDGIEWGSDVHVPEGNLEYAEHIRKISRDVNLEVISYASYYYANNNQNFTQFLSTARVLGAQDIRIWAGKFNPNKETGVIDFNEMAAIVADIQRIADEAAQFDIDIHIEHHGGTYTDTAESAYQLIKAIDKPNVFLYWQPAISLSVGERIESINLIKDYISNIHVFHWDNESERYPLSAGVAAWHDYIDILETDPVREHTYLLEFVKDDSSEQFFEDVKTLKKWLSLQEASRR